MKPPRKPWAEGGIIPVREEWTCLIKNQITIFLLLEIAPAN